MESLLAIKGFFIDFLLKPARQNTNGGNKLCYPNSCIKMLRMNRILCMIGQGWKCLKLGWKDWRSYLSRLGDGNQILSLVAISKIMLYNIDIDMFFEPILLEEYRLILIPTFMSALDE